MPPDSPPAFTSYGSDQVGASMGNYVDAVTDPALTKKIYDAEAGANKAYTGLEMEQLNQLLNGSMADFDVGAAWNDLTDAEREDYKGAGANQGIDGVEWFKRMVLEQSQKGDQKYQDIVRRFRDPSKKGLIGLYGDATKAVSQIDAEANTAARRADVTDLRELGPEANAAYRASNPEYAAAMSRAEGMAKGPNSYANLQGLINNPAQFKDITGQTVGRGQLGQNLYDQALGANGLGQVGQSLQNRALGFSNSTGELSADEMRNLQQSTREAYAARGTEMGSGAISAEALSRLTGQRNRMMEDLGMASDLNQAGQKELESNRGFQQDVYGKDQERIANNINFTTGLQRENRAFNYGAYQDNIQNQSNLADKLQGLYDKDRLYSMDLVNMQKGAGYDLTGRMNNAVGAGIGAANFASELAGTNMGPSYVDAGQGVNIDMTNAANKGTYDATTWGATEARKGAEAGASATKTSGGLGLFGDIAKTVIPMIPWCWVAREVYGTEDGKWLQFREWLLRKSPRWFYKLYIKHGERFAEWLKNKPRTKKLIKFWMDGRIATMKEINSRSAEEIS